MKNEFENDISKEETKENLNDSNNIEMPDEQNDEIQEIDSQTEKEELYEENDQDEQDNKEIGFDYRSYLSTPRFMEDDYKESDDKEIEKPKDQEKHNKNKDNQTLKIVLTSTACSVAVCAIFIALFIFLLPRTNILQQELPAFKTYKNITIEATSNELIAEVAEKVSPSVVGIKTTVITRDFLFGLTESTPEGSGIIFREDGYILTNNHVVENALLNNTNTIANGCKIEVILPTSTETAYEAKVVGRDTKTDLAVLKIEKTGLQAAEFDNSDNIRVGQTAIAIGNPGGTEYMGSVTAGIISGLNRKVELGNGKQLKLVQTDAAINPGNSGGALVNTKGEVIGVNTVKIAGSVYEGLGFAIPSNTVKEVVESLVEYNYVKGRPFLGIKVDTRYTESIAKQNNMPMGVYVASVDLLSAADKAGIERGDIITEFDGAKIKDINDLNSKKNNHIAGDEVKVKLYRVETSRYQTVTVKLGEDIGTKS